MLAAQAWIERSERRRLDAALELDRRDEQVSARRQSLLEASRERQAIDKLAERREAEHMREWSRRAQGELDEVALAVHRRGSAVR
jgi:flagellar FliJ protein